MDSNLPLLATVKEPMTDDQKRMAGVEFGPPPARSVGLTIYDRERRFDKDDNELPTYIRTAKRGHGQPLLAPVKSPDPAPSTSKPKPKPDARLFAIQSTVFTVLVPALKAEKNPAKRQRIMAEIKRLRAQGLKIGAAAGLRPSAARARQGDKFDRNAPTYRASQAEARQMTAKRAQHSLAVSSERDW